MKNFTVVMMGGGVEPFIVHATATSPESAIMDARSKVGFDPDWPDLVGVFEGHLNECLVDEVVLTTLVDDELARLETIRDWHEDSSRIGGPPLDFRLPLAWFRPHLPNESSKIV